MEKKRHTKHKQRKRSNREKMKLKVKQIPIGTGDIRVAVMNAKDATQRDLYSEDRILIKKGFVFSIIWNIKKKK